MTPEIAARIYVIIAVLIFLSLLIAWNHDKDQFKVELGSTQLPWWIVPLALWVMAILWPFLVIAIIRAYWEKYQNKL